MAHEVSPESAMASAIASVEMAGFTVTGEDRALLQRVAAGELSATEAMQLILREYRHNPDPAP